MVVPVVAVCAGVPPAYLMNVWAPLPAAVPFMSDAGYNRGSLVLPL